jgi:hypothetical protein
MTKMQGENWEERGAVAGRMRLAAAVPVADFLVNFFLGNIPYAGSYYVESKGSCFSE